MQPNRVDGGLYVGALPEDFLPRAPPSPKYVYAMRQYSTIIDSYQRRIGERYTPKLIAVA